MQAILKRAALGLVAMGLSSFAAATTIDQAFWEVYYFGANPPSQGAPVEWANESGVAGGILPDDASLSQFSQSGSRVTLKPNVHFCSNALGQAQSDIDYWCYTPTTPDKGKWMVARSYTTTSVPVGPASTVEFDGCIVNNTLSDHSFSAYVRVFSADYSQLWYEETDSSGSFSLPATLAGDAAANVQVGFVVTGPTVSPDQIDDYGSVVVDMGGQCAAAPTSEFDPNAIPALPFGGLLGLIGLVGWLGLRRRI